MGMAWRTCGWGKRSAANGTSRGQRRKRRHACQAAAHGYFFLDLDEVLTHAEVMEKAIFLLKDCDAMILCDGWQDSKGCQEEYAYAKENGIRVIPFSKWAIGI